MALLAASVSLMLQGQFCEGDSKDNVSNLTLLHTASSSNGCISWGSAKLGFKLGPGASLLFVQIFIPCEVLDVVK